VGETRRVTIQEAARILGVSEGAVRKRVKRGTLPHYKEQPSGRVYVQLDGGTHRVAEGVDDGVPHEPEALISEMRGRVQFLEAELQRKDAILLNMTEVMKALSPSVHEEPSESPGAPTEATEQPGRVEPQAAVEGEQEDTERPWWRRMFGA
jgi:excisionase family DNA binding protein